MKVFLFPGQGSHAVGMGADLFASDPGFGRLVALASARVGTDLQKLCLRGPERELMRTEFLQPLLVAVCLGYWGKLAEKGIEPDLVLGHSLGEISALAATGVLTAEEAVTVATRRGEVMGLAAARLTGGMIAVLSSHRDQLLATLDPVLRAERVFLANDNAPDQLVLSGPTQGLEEAARLIAEARVGRCKRLAVGGPFHSPLMAAARREFADWLQTIPFHPPRVPLLMNVSATPETDPERIRMLISRNLTEPAQWRACMDRLRAMRPRVLFEIGPGRVLSGLARANGFGNEVRLVSVSHLRALDMLGPAPAQK